MKIVITGAAGFLGRRLAGMLLRRGALTGPEGESTSIQQILLLDQTAPEGIEDPRLEVRTGDIADPDTIRAALGDDTASVFHLAAVVSGQAEADFDLGMAVNFQATHRLLEACRALPNAPRFVFASSVAVFGGDLPGVVRDATAPNPQSSYGTQKAMGELLVNDYSRRGFVDGRAVRLPTITVRPGKPNQAASSFASGIIREPLAGVPTVGPVAAATELWLLSPRKAIEDLVLAHELPASAFGGDRRVNLPGVTVSVAEMVEALRKLAGDETADLIEWRHDAAVDRIVSSWPGAFDTERAARMGFQADEDFESIIRAYREDEGIGAENNRHRR